MSFFIAPCGWLGRDSAFHSTSARQKSEDRTLTNNPYPEDLSYPESSEFQEMLSDIYVPRRDRKKKQPLVLHSSFSDTPFVMPLHPLLCSSFFDDRWIDSSGMQLNTHHRIDYHFLVEEHERVGIQQDDMPISFGIPKL